MRHHRKRSQGPVSLVQSEIIVLGSVYSPHMYPKVTGSREELVADVTLVLLQPRMSFQVPLQFAFGDEALTTLLAYERLLFCMREAMQLQVIVQLEALLADLAGVLLLLGFVQVFYGYPGAVALEVLL